MRHWRGELSLGQAFWINLALIRAALFYADGLFRPPFISYVGDHLVAAITFSVISTFVIFPWQVVGVIRACDRLAGEPGAGASVIGAQIGIVLGLLTTLISVYAIFQPLTAERPDEPLYITWQRDRADKYEVSVDETGRWLAISGEFELGLTRTLREAIAAAPQARGLVLSSGGGFVNQGRAVARVVEEYGLETFVAGDCLSACTIAFAAGKKRWLTPDARLGFHRYFYAGRTAHPAIDYEEEYRRDHAFFREHGVSEAFLERMFSADHVTIWYPDTAELLAAGVIHGVTEVPFTPR
ncbi:MAG: hypothetical protein RIC16_06390 [Rhodospirillales bacterium]